MTVETFEPGLRPDSPHEEQASEPNDQDKERDTFIKEIGRCSWTKQQLAQICNEHWSRHAFLQRVAPDSVSDEEAVGVVFDELLVIDTATQPEQIFAEHGLEVPPQRYPSDTLA